MSLRSASIEDLIDQEIEAHFTQQEIAVMYAFALRSSTSIDWKRMNGAIVRRWSRGGLLAVKRHAWKLQGERRP